MPSWWFTFAARNREIGTGPDWWLSFNDPSRVDPHPGGVVAR
jgi:hypothetical protein